MRNYKMALLAALFVLLASGYAQAQTVNICEEVEEIITHPERYAVKKIRENRSCILFPMCCAPGWQLNPVCYVTKRVKVKDAWEEVKTSVKCNDYSPKEALDRWISHFFSVNPTTFVNFVPDFLAEPFGTYIEIAKSDAKPLSEKMKSQLIEIKRRGNLPYTDSDLNAAHWIYSNHPSARMLFRKKTNSDDLVGAIVYYDLIIVREDIKVDVSNCENIALLAHEMVHVHQYRKLGWNTFLSAYLREGVANGYPNISYEIEGSTFEKIACDVCLTYKIDKRDYWWFSDSGMSDWQILSNIQVDLNKLRFGDFNGDGKTDVFTSQKGRWRYSDGGIGNWVDLATSNTPIENLRFEDFDGDGKTDVFTSDGKRWKYSSGGAKSWQLLASSKTPLENLRFGDFDGDGKTDVFTSDKGHWKYSPGGTKSWQLLASSTTPLDHLRFGDFDGDGKTDVFTSDKGRWKYSSGGAKSWQLLASSKTPLENLRFVDFDGDGKTDVFTSHEGQWKFSSSGAKSWANLAKNYGTISDLRFGDFNGDGRTDVFKRE